LPRHRPEPRPHAMWPRSDFYLGPTPRLQRLTPVRPRQAPATKPAPEVLPALVMSFEYWVTWLGGVTLRPLAVCPGSRHGIVSTQGLSSPLRDFGGQNTEAPPYPSAKVVRHRPRLARSPLPRTAFSATSPTTLTGKPFCKTSGLSWLSSSRPWICQGTRTWSNRSGSGCHQPGGSPRRLTLNAPVRIEQARTPWADLRPPWAAHRLRDMTASTDNI
jgi:hypothetical protein